MNFLEEIEEMQKNRNNIENIVINDILKYFEEKMNSERFKDILKNNYIKDAIDKGKNSCDLKIEFWDYITGCSKTFIYVGGCGKFELNNITDSYDSYHNYKGVRLKDIHKNICSKLSVILKNKLEELGLKIVSSERLDNNYRFGYYNETIKISWQ